MQAHQRVSVDPVSPQGDTSRSVALVRRLAGLRSLPLRLAGYTCALLVTWGTAVRLLVLFHEGAPERHQWVHFALGTGYEIMSGCVGALLIYGIAVAAPRVGRWSAFGLVSFLLLFNYTDYIYFLLFQAHLPFSALEYVPQISDFGSSIRGAVLDVRFVFLVVLPALLAGRLLLLPGRRPKPTWPGWGWKAHALAVGSFLLAGLIANTTSNSYVGKNPENALQFTPLQHFIESRGQLKAAPVELTADVLARLNPPDPRYPLLHERAFAGCRHPDSAFRDLCAGAEQAGLRSGKGPNIVFVMLESFRAQEIGALGGRIAATSGQTLDSHASITPRFDALAQQGLLFRHFYGNGFQTRDGIVASYCSLYPNTGEPVLRAYPYVTQRCLPALLRTQGYRTVWIHNGDADFDGQRGFLLRNGIERIIDRWDFPMGTPTAGWGVTDEALMDKALETMRALPEPFFAGILTITNHHPFEPPAGFATHGTDEYGRFLDTMAYTDFALGRLFQRARAEPFFRNTVFFIYADHAVPQPSAAPVRTPRDELVWRHHIPLLIWADWLKSPKTVDAPGSQVDLPPLVLDLLGMRATVPWVGQSPVARPLTLPALVVRPGAYVGLLDAQGAALWLRSQWQESGGIKPARLRWAQDITLAARWALEQQRIVPGP